MALEGAYRGATPLLQPVNGYVRDRSPIEGVPGEFLGPASGQPVERDVPLEGQEFLRLAACESADEVADFVRAFGPSGADRFVDPLALPFKGSTDVPLVRAVGVQGAVARVVRGPVPPLFEPLDDLVRHAALLRAISDAYVLSRDDERRAKAVGRLRSRLRRRDDRTIRPLAREEAEDLELVSGLVRAGFDTLWLRKGPRPRRAGDPPDFLVIERTPMQSALALRAVRVVHGVKSRVPQHAVRPRPRHIALSAEGLRQFVADVVDHALRATGRRVLEVEGESLVIGSEVPRAFLPVAYVEAAETFARQLTVRECSFSGCRQPRPHLFLFKTRLVGRPEGDRWVWERIERPERYRGEKYCSEECVQDARPERAGGSKREWTDTERTFREERRASRLAERGGSR